MADFTMGLGWRTRAIVIAVAFVVSLSVIGLWAAGKTFALVVGDFLHRADEQANQPPPEPKMQDGAMPFQVVTPEEK
jgi:hypothetical protein